MSKTRWLYWILQLAGWGGLVFFGGLLTEYQETGTVQSVHMAQAFTFFAVAISVTHFYRTIIVKFNGLEKGISSVVPIILIGSFFVALGILFLDFGITFFIKDNVSYTLGKLINSLISLYILSLIWSIIYYAYHFFNKSRQQEIKNLQLESAQKESELTGLKNQLNPHFMFNAMNGIRALIDENPVLAKRAITQFSNLLRNTLELGKKRLISVEEEMKVVSDYLMLEQIRYEERLSINLKVNQDSRQALIPPLLIQTLVENGIKHGISKLENGGMLQVEVNTLDKALQVSVLNDGKYNPNLNAGEGIGIINTKKRLAILFGESASLSIQNRDDKVHTLITIPNQKEVKLKNKAI